VPVGHGQTAAPEVGHRLDHTTLLDRMLFASRLRFMDTFEAVGKVTGHAKLEAEGEVHKAAGTAQSTIDELKDTLRGK
jgi:phosphohistidine phosphatase SixA